MRVLLQAVIGFALTAIVASALIYSSIPPFWEHEDQPHVYSITWHSWLLLTILLAIAQVASFMLMKRLKRP